MKRQTRASFFFLLFLAVYTALLGMIFRPTMLVPDTNVETESVAAKAVKVKISKRPSCSNTNHLFNSSEVLDSAYTQLEQFHNGGGNLKTIETYLNEQMDPTLSLLGVTFTPDGSKDPIPTGNSTTKGIKDLFRQQDKNKRGGYDQRVMPGNFNSPDPNMKALRGKKIGNWYKYYMFDVMEPDDLSRWDKGLGPILGICSHLDKILPMNRKRSYEEKMMCSYPGANRDDNEQEDKKNDPDHANGYGPNCNMISIGSNREWGFEESVAAQTSCRTHTFDCTTAANPKKPDVDSIHYYPYCLANENKKIEDRDFITYFGMVEKIGLTKAPDLLKMDVEGFEFDILTQMLDHTEKTNSKHLLPAQISLELHYATRMYDLPWHLRFRQTAEIAMFAGMMYNRGGYMLVETKLDEGCKPCAEVLFVRAFCD